MTGEDIILSKSEYESLLEEVLRLQAPLYMLINMGLLGGKVPLARTSVLRYYHLIQELTFDSS